jgi:hypothetical protein
MGQASKYGRKIWEDPWLPREHTRRPFTPRRNCLLTRVDELIDPTVGTWDEALIRDLFWEDDAKTIWCIPVHDGMEDIIISWHYNKNGLFSARSAQSVC